MDPAETRNEGDVGQTKSMWDVEEDHLLSYFLGNENPAAGSGAVAESADISESRTDSGMTASSDTRTALQPLPLGMPGTSQDFQQHQQQQQEQQEQSNGSSLLGSSFSSPTSKIQVQPSALRARHSGDTEQSSNSGSNGSAQVTFISNADMPLRRDTPSTPAVQFYSRSSSKTSKRIAPSPTPPDSLQPSLSSSFGTSSHLNPTSLGAPASMQRVYSSSSSSSSSLGSIAAAFVNGGGGQAVMHIHHQLQAKGQELPTPPTHASPISPAAMIGINQENLMLPPPPRLPLNSERARPPSNSAIPAHWTSNSLPQSSTTINGHQRRQHTEWLQQMNSLAMAAAQAKSALGNGTILPNQTMAPQHQQHNMPPRQQPNQSHFSNSFMASQPTTATTTANNTAVFPQTQMPFSSVSQNAQHHQHQQQLQRPTHTGVPSMVVPAPGAPATTTTTTHPQSIVTQIQHPTVVVPTAGAGAVSTTSSDAQVLAMAAAAAAAAGTSHAGESAERRARRLARNRESARQSRRRKKELLIKLGAQVNKLQNEIEDERRVCLKAMESELSSNRADIIHQVQNLITPTDEENAMNKGMATTHSLLSDRLASVVRLAGPNCQPRRAAAAFQYNLLRNLILPPYKQFLLWLLLNQESYFTAGKEEKSKASKASGRISSKQIGEEITNTRKGNKRGSGQTMKNPQVSCAVDRADEFWPLLCFELAISVEQEERALQAQRSFKDNKKLVSDGAQVCVAASMATTLKTGVLFQCHSAAHRNEVALLDILTPTQSARFLEWFLLNKDRCRGIIAKGNNNTSSMMSTTTTPSSSSLDNDNSGLNNNHGGAAPKEKSLNDICQQLNDALKIRKQEL